MTCIPQRVYRLHHHSGPTSGRPRGHATFLPMDPGKFAIQFGGIAKCSFGLPCFGSRRCVLSSGARMPSTARPALFFRRAETLTLSALSLLLRLVAQHRSVRPLAQSVCFARGGTASSQCAGRSRRAARSWTPKAKAKPAAKPLPKAPAAAKPPVTVQNRSRCRRKAPCSASQMSISEPHQRRCSSSPKDGSRFNTALGVIVKPNGVVVSDSRLVSGVEKAKSSHFVRCGVCWRRRSADLPARKPSQSAAGPGGANGCAESLAAAPAPEPPVKQQYRSLDLFDVKTATAVGADVIGLRTHGRQTLAMMSGSIMAVRPASSKRTRR